MNIKPRIETIKEKKLIGMHEQMSLIENKTYKLFSTFMPRKKEIQNVINIDTYDLRVYPQNYYSNFSPSNYFTKWALVEVSDWEHIPNKMEKFNLIGGKYAIFDYKGLSSDNRIFHYIFTNWLPNSNYELDDRPHFEILGEKTKFNDPNSEEEIWIPIRDRVDAV